MDEKICWTCGHYAFGCFVTGKYNNNVSSEDTCNKWSPEGTKGTVTDYADGEADGTTWGENEFLKDDISNL